MDAVQLILGVVAVVSCCLVIVLGYRFISGIMKAKTSLCESETYMDESKVLMTCTTYFSKPGKYEQFSRAMNSFSSKEDLLKIGEIVVINEFDEKDRALGSYADKIKREFPHIKLIQKQAKDKGQARSLNIILDLVTSSKFKYWIHWEESWVVSRPFVEDAISIMDEDKRITQMQLTSDWHNIPQQFVDNKGNHVVIETDPRMITEAAHNREEYDKLIERTGFDLWPLYSLRPSINRVEHYRKLSSFSEDPEMWPVVFEYLYGVEWLKAGSVKAFIEPSSAQRQEGHVSTYA